MILDEVDAGTRTVLDRFGFDPEAFELLRGRVASGELSAAANVVRGSVEPPRARRRGASSRARLRPLARCARGRDRAAPGRPRRAGRARRRDGDALRRCRQGRGRGARRSQLPLLEARRDRPARRGPRRRDPGRADDELPDRGRDACPRRRARRPGAALVLAVRLAAPRPRTASSSCEDGARPRSTHRATATCSMRSAARARSRRCASSGVEHVAVSNVDNLGARLDPVVLGAHVLAGRPMTAEVARKEGDMGGAPARVDGRLGLLEGPQFPPAFDQDRITVFNTNTTTLALDAIDREFDLAWLYVRKSVDGRAAVQLERLYHQVAWELEATFLEVPRSGDRGRFFPIKEPEDLGALATRTPRDARRIRARVTDSARRRRRAVTPARPSVGSWACSGWCCRHAARDAASPETRSARGASRRSSGSGRRCASGAAAPGRGRCAGASNAPGGGSASRGRGPRSSTTDGRGRSSRRGRSEGGATSSSRSPRSSRRSSPGHSVDAVTFVPGDRERGRDRGHVPVARLAQALADRWDLPVARLLARSGPSSRQAGLSRADRRANVRDLFVARSEAPRTARARRRRVHDGGDRSRLRDDAAAGGSAVGRGRLPRAGGALALAYRTDDEEVPCDSRSPCGVDTSNDDVRSYVEAKFAKLGKRLHESTLVEVVLDRERNPRIADDHVVEAELHVKGPNLHGREAAPDVRGRDRPARRRARTVDRARAGQEGAGAAAPRAGRRASRAGAGRGDRAGAPHRRLRCRCRTIPGRTGARSGSTGSTATASGTPSRRSLRPISWATTSGSSCSTRGTSSPRKASVDARLVSSVALAAPFRAHAVRRDAGIWVVGASRIRTVALVDDPGGSSVELAWDGRERSVRIDGEPTLAGVPELERLGAERHATYVVTAARLDGSIWEVFVAPL